MKNAFTLVELIVVIAIVAIISALIIPVIFTGCSNANSVGNSSNEVKKLNVNLNVDKDGMTSEQKNVNERLIEDNKPGSIKHLYIISAYSGQVIIYSTVKGKVTSSGKRLNPEKIESYSDSWNNRGISTNIRGEEYYTNEVMNDDGTYGSSVEYLYWWDTKGIYHQHYVSGGQIVHISSDPIAVKSIIINMETSSSEQVDTQVEKQ